MFKAYSDFLNESRAYSNSVSDIEPILKEMLVKLLKAASKDAMAGHMHGKQIDTLKFRSKQFPIGKCTVNLRWVVRDNEPTLRTAASYKNDMQIVDNKAEFSVNFDIRIPLTFYLTSRDETRFFERVEKELINKYFFDSFIAHEFTHALDDYKLIKKGDLGIAGTPGYAKNVTAQKLLSAGNPHQAFMDLFYYMYASDPVEMRAMIAGTATRIKAASRKDAVEILRDSEAYKTATLMEKFSIHDFKKIPLGDLQKEIIEIIDLLNTNTNYAAQVALTLKKETTDINKFKMYLSTLKAPDLTDTPDEFLKPLIADINTAGKKMKRKLLKLISVS